jgi:hypothetical protein
MAITQNTFTGNGSNLGPFSFTFQWLESTDIKVTVAGVLKTAGTHYNLQSLNYATKSGGQVLFTAGNAPANGAAIVIYRQTDDADLVSTFYSGSAIRAQDLNNNFTQGLYVTQEANNNVTTANADASTALTTANTALSNSTAAQSSAATAISTANAASASASSAVSTANAASASAASAVSTANTANANATAALNAAAEALAYVIVANVAAIPASPVNGDAVRVTDSTGIQSFTPLTGIPVGFVGDAGLTVEIYYNSSSSSWVWVRYYPTDSDARYLKLTGGTLTGQLRADDSTSVAAPVYSFDGDVNTGLAHPGADELALVTGGTARLTVDPSGAVNVPVSLSVGANAVLNTSNIGTSVQAYDVTILKSSNIGTSVQGYDADTAKTDIVQTFTVAQRGAVSALTSAATVTPDFAVSNNFSLTLGHSITLANPTNLTAGQSGAIVITQGSGTAYTVAYGGYWKFSGGTPTMSTELSSVSTLVYYVESSTRITARLITNVT